MPYADPERRAAYMRAYVKRPMAIIARRRLEKSAARKRKMAGYVVRYLQSAKGKATAALRRVRSAVEIKARGDANHAIRDGLLVRKPCEVCGARKVEAHHDDYAKPLDVRWLCKLHHTELHYAIDRQKHS